jgi:hypothetical protein
MKKMFIVYVLTILLGLFIGWTGTVAVVNHDVYYLGAALGGTVVGVVGICAIAWFHSITKENG